ncbi:shikimate dehydrogenase family protein [Oceanicola sp. S124]|uniref:shikimate dehydrogenase family protein n=1 Tax=Oceanicola sp. S124 TaxID=1042378 RepID=UPI0002559F31|nr:shikimate dehydrogenase substrate-binding domain protein [Oceanicola sp. S124]
MPIVPTAAARLAYMIGHPIAHTAMPAGVNAWARDSGTDAIMAPVDVAPEALAGFIAALRGTANCDGAVVTAPHKIAMAGLVDELTPAARLVGAANVVIRDAEGRLTGDNTDGAGFVAALTGAGVPLAGRVAVLFGCGGAGASIAAALVASGLGRLDLVDPDGEKARALADALGPVARVASAPESLAGHDLVINATAIGLDGVSSVHPLTGLRPDALAGDVVTKPPVTPFLRQAERLGAAIQPGSAMALAQIPLVLRLFGWTE